MNEEIPSYVPDTAYWLAIIMWGDLKDAVHWHNSHSVSQGPEISDRDPDRMEVRA